MTAISGTGTSRPFDVDRDGFVMGEGAAVFMLEEWDMAHARGATILGEVLGGASNADAHHITAPSPGGVGAITCISWRSATPGSSRSDIKQINAHGTSTPLNDAAEAAAITEVFGAGRSAGRVDQGRHRSRARAPPARSRRRRWCCRSSTG